MKSEAPGILKASLLAGGSLTIAVLLMILAPISIVQKVIYGSLFSAAGVFLIVAIFMRKKWRE